MEEQYSWCQPLVRQYRSTGTVCDGVGDHEASQSPPLKSNWARIKILHFKHDVAFVCRGGALALPICSVSLKTSKWPKFTQILGEVSVRAQHMTGIKASAQLDGAGRYRGLLQLKASGERHDGLCARCLAEGKKKKVTMLRTVWQCLCCPTGDTLSEGRAGPLHHSLLSGCAACWSLTGQLWETARQMSGAMTWVPDNKFYDG